MPLKKFIYWRINGYTLCVHYFLYDEFVRQDQERFNIFSMKAIRFRIEEIRFHVNPFPHTAADDCENI